ncbi:metallopeptidase family protein [Primorskyibacter sp. S187A]|uniref:metallopeptidase family protein n=1 Tax=Primorskyibacter sp. S187A TaxID=3415130 RepID=UPI003C7DD8A8
MTDSPDIAAFYTMAESARAGLPEAFAPAAAQVVLRIEDRPSEAMLAAIGLDDPMLLTGLYDGIPLTEKSVFDVPEGPDVIWLFRAPILAEWRARGNVSLSTLVAHVYVHELAHHFGWSDDDIAEIDRWWE